MKHTKGPWAIDACVSTRVMDATGKTIASTGMSSYISQEESQSNARLIAAADDMLEMLIEASDLLYHYSDVVDGDWPDGPRPNKAMALRQEIEAVIAKATGGRP